MISPGANVTEGQAVMELETDKAVIEVPSSVSGTIKDVRVKEGEKIKVGQVIFTVENGTGAKAKAAEGKEASGEKSASAALPATPEVKTEIPPQTQPQTAPASPPAASTSKTATPKTTTSKTTEFRLPELGENIEQGDLVRLMISPGAKISEGQAVMELETEKAVVEVPSSVSGVVKDVLVKQGEKVKVGQVIFTVEGDTQAQPQEAKPAPADESQAKSEAAKPAPEDESSGQHGARFTFQPAIKAEGKTEEQALPRDQAPPAPSGFAMPTQLGKVAGTEHREPVPAAPHVRRLARELGIDIHDVKGSGPGGRISEDDVKAHSKSLLASVAAAAHAPRTHVDEPALPDFAKWGKIERVSMRGVRRKTAEHLW